jgi:hypothetical protein
VEPQLVDDGLGGLAVLEGVGPFASMLVLMVLPFRSYSGLEEVIVGLDG